MFKDNKYTKHYNLLIEKAKNRTLPKETYTEKHHIIPRSMGGSNKKENLAHLTAREHFICHWLESLRDSSITVYSGVHY
jgi:hypothetical protein